MSLLYIFWSFVILFSIVGVMRGWGKEIVVTFCAIVGLAIIALFRRYVPMIADLPPTNISLFWFQTIVVTVLVYFGYEIVNLPYLATRTTEAGQTRDRLASSLFGSVLGAFNGYLLVGSIILYIAAADFPFPRFVARPSDPSIVESINEMLELMPPSVLSEPGIYIAVIFSFLLITVIFSYEQGSRA